MRPLRYQLLHAVAGTLREAEQRGTDIAVFLVHEFCGPSCTPENTRRNADDFRAFTICLGVDSAVAAEGLAGPLRMAVGARTVAFFIGHVKTAVP